MKQFFKQHKTAFGWFSTYFIAQIIFVVLFFVGTLILNEELYAGFVVGTQETSDLIYEQIMNMVEIPVFICSSFVIMWRFRRKMKKDESVKEFIKPISKIQICDYVKYGVIIHFVCTAAVELIRVLSQTEKIPMGITSSTFFIYILGFGILVPIMEEIVFRYGIGNSLSKINYKYALIVQALIFALMHGNLIQMIYTFFMGIIFMHHTKKENNLLPAIIMHATINTSSIIIEGIGINFIAWFIIVISVVITIKKILIQKETNAK